MDVEECGYDSYEGPIRKAFDIAITNIPSHTVKHYFDTDTMPIYWCEEADAGLEAVAYQALDGEFERIHREYANTANYACASRNVPDADFFVVRVRVACSCGGGHIAIFYCDFKTNDWRPSSSSDFPLAGITSCNLSARLNGLYTKAEIMQALEKLVIRWRLTMDQVLVAAPFVGHQFLKPEQKLAIWDWLIGLLDPTHSLLITRASEFSTYKRIIPELEGLDHAVLSEYGLASKLVAANTSKHDFHAKFFVGIFKDFCEVLSGSANLVSGKSIENICFQSMSHDHYERRYLKKLNMRLPTAMARSAYFIRTAQEESGKWQAQANTGSRLA